MPTRCAPHPCWAARSWPQAGRAVRFAASRARPTPFPSSRITWRTQRKRNRSDLPPRNMTTRHEMELIDSATRAQTALDEALGSEKMIINMGPQHPSTHGVLRVVLELDGEEVVNVWPDIGYLHRGDEKIAENMTYTQFIPYTDRLDYLAPLANNVTYAYAVEKLLGMDVPPRCKYIRVIVAELARISSHLLGLGSFGMDVGAMTIFLYLFRERA